MHRSLPIAAPSPKKTAPLHHFPELLSELQALGVRWVDASGPGLSRSGGAGPSDHKAVTLMHQTVMVPILNHASALSPYTAEVQSGGQSALLLRAGEPIAELGFPKQPEFYKLFTDQGVPYWKIALMHLDSLASTVFQRCVYWGTREQCHFCAIGRSE